MRTLQTHRVLTWASNCKRAQQALPCPSVELVSELRDGEGGFGEVFVARFCGHTVAAKRLKQGREAAYETQLLTECSHPKVVACFGQAPLSGQTTLVVLMQLMSGTLSDVRLYNGLIAARDLATACQDILGALAHIHALQIVHRDVKPDNFLVANEKDPPFLARLGDFGEAVRCTRGQTLKERRGTSAYVAPEMYGTRGYDTQADLWSAGLTVYWLLYDQLPWAPPDTPRFPGAPGAWAERYPDLVTQILREPIVSSA